MQRGQFVDQPNKIALFKSADSTPMVRLKMIAYS